jgi:hypothetical protein
MKKYVPDSTPVLTEKVFVKMPQVFYGGGTVYEASMDENYDVVIVDLPPIDKIVQRFGRANRYAPMATRRSVDTQHPPQLATILLCLFLSAADRDNMIGDLDEKFPKWVERHGARIARFLYLKDACATIYPAAQKLWWRMFKLLAKIGGIAGIAEIIRRIRFW